MSATRRMGITVLTLVACVGCDQSTKYVAKQLLQGRDTVSMMGDLLRLGYAENVGGFLGLGAALPEHWRTGVFLLFSAFALAVLLTYAVASRNVGMPQRLAVALIVGGGFGNLIDRFLNDGGVVDFLNVGVGPLRTGIFNVADMAILGGAIMVLFSAARGRRHKDA